MGQQTGATTLSWTIFSQTRICMTRYICHCSFHSWFHKGWTLAKNSYVPRVSSSLTQRMVSLAWVVREVAKCRWRALSGSLCSEAGTINFLEVEAAVCTGICSQQLYFSAIMIGMNSLHLYQVLITDLRLLSALYYFHLLGMEKLGMGTQWTVVSLFVDLIAFLSKLKKRTGVWSPNPKPLHTSSPFNVQHTYVMKWTLLNRENLRQQIIKVWVRISLNLAPCNFPFKL